MRPLSALTWIFAALNLAGFAMTLGLLVPVLLHPTPRSAAYAPYGHGVACGLIAAILGWAWAVQRSLKAGSAVNGWTEAMCAATAILHACFLGATVALIGGRAADGRLAPAVWHIAIAVVLAVLIGRARRRPAVTPQTPGARSSPPAARR